LRGPKDAPQGRGKSGMRRRLLASASDASREALNSSKQREAPPLPPDLLNTSGWFSNFCFILPASGNLTSAHGPRHRSRKLRCTVYVVSNWPRCAISGRSWTAWRVGQVRPFATLRVRSNSAGGRQEGWLAPIRLRRLLRDFPRFLSRPRTAPRNVERCQGQSDWRRRRYRSTLRRGFLSGRRSSARHRVQKCRSR
jgi:hypothetical protein